MTENAATESVYNGREPEGATTAGSHRLEPVLNPPSRRDNSRGATSWGRGQGCENTTCA